MMSKSQQFTDEQLQLLEVFGLDLLSQAEAAVRAVRDYQRAIQQLRGIRATSNGDAGSIGTVHSSVKQLHAGCADLSVTVDGILGIVEPASVQGRQHLKRASTSQP
jgi:hypothetical protein